MEGAREHSERTSNSLPDGPLGRDRVVLAAIFDAEHAEPALFVVEDGALDETDRIYDLKISPSRWIELSTCSCGSPGHWHRIMK